MMSDPRAASTTSLVTTSVVDVEDAGDLGEQSLDEAKVAPGGPDNGGEDIRVVELPRRHLEPELAPVVRHDRGDLVRRERPELVGESDSAVELRVAGQTPLHPRHAD